MKPSAQTKTPNERLQAKYDDRNLRHVERFLSAISPTNQPGARQFVQTKKGQGVASSTLRLYSLAAEKFDASLNGRHYTTTTPEDATAFLNGLRAAGLMPGSVRTIVQYAKSILTHALDVDTLPRKLRIAFRVERSGDLDAERLVSDDQFAAFLAELPTLMDQAFAAVLWESGLRLSEALSLYTESIRFDDKEGAWITLPKDGADLKTDARSVYVSSRDKPCATIPLLRAWMQAHPTREAATSPLWVGNANRNLGRRIGKDQVHVRWAQAARQANVTPFSPHDLRHTAATRDAEHDATESDLRAKYGWGDRSAMPAYYVKRRRNRQENVARRSVGLDAHGRTTITEDPNANITAAAAAAAAIAVEAVFKRMGLTPQG